MRTAFLAALVLLASSLAHADTCALMVGVSNVAINWDLNFNFQAITVTVTKTSQSACDYGIAFSRGGASNYTRRLVSASNVALNYQLFGDANLSRILKYAGDITSTNDVLQGHFNAGTVPPQQQTYYVQVPLALATAPSFKPYGNYTDTFDVSAYSGTDPTQFATALATQSVNVSVLVPKIVQLSIGQPGASFDPSQVSNAVAFGNLTPGMYAQRDLLVRTNAGYSVSFSSLNHGVMVHSNPNVKTTIPYTFMMNAGAIDLTPNTSAPFQLSGLTSIEGNRNPIMIQVGNVLNAMAGTYSDTISISVNSTD